MLIGRLHDDLFILFYLLQLGKATATKKVISFAISLPNNLF